MKKLVQSIVFSAIYVWTPLVMDPALLVTWKIQIVFLVAVLLFWTQPEFKVKDAKVNRKTDKNSFWVIYLLSFLALWTPLIDWAYGLTSIKIDLYSISSLLGTGIMLTGLGLRVYAINYLGKQFTGTVEIVKDHQLITGGPYSAIRHPSYTGSLLTFVGAAILLESWIGLVTAIFCMTIAYYYRIKTEEKILTQTFGRLYGRYRASTYASIPYVW